MNAENKPAGPSANDLGNDAVWIMHNIRIAKHLVDHPEYFYQQPTPEQEVKYKKDYSVLWKRLAARDNVSVPKTIKTFFGKTEFIQDELHFRDFCNIKYGPQDQDYQDLKDRIVDYESLRKERWETRSKKLNRLSKDKLKELQAKTANEPLQTFDFPSGDLISLPDWY